MTGTPMTGRARNWLRRLGIAYCGYLALVILVAMPAANIMLPRIYQEQTGRDLQFDAILLNPFTLGITVVRASDRNPDGELFWAFDELLLDVGLWRSLLGRHLVLDHLHLLGLHLDVWRDGEQFNFSDILQHRAQRDQGPYASEATASTGLPALTLHRLVFSATHLGYSERHREEPFETFARNLGFQLWGLTTHVDEGQPYQLEARDESGGRLYWQGQLSLAGGHSQGLLALDDISLLPAWRYFAPQLGVVVNSALLNLQARYALTWGEGTPELQVEDGHLNLHQMQLHGREDADTIINWQSLSLAGIALDSHEQSLRIAALELRGLDLAGHSEAAEVSLLPLLRFGNDDAHSAQPDPEAVTPGTGPNGWQLLLEQLTLRDSRVRWQAAELAEPLEITPRLTLGNLHWPAAEEAELALDLSINQDSQLRLSGTLVPVHADLDIQGDIRQLPLPWFQPLLQQYLSAVLDSGSLDADWQLRLEGGAAQTAAAELQVDTLQLLDADDVLLGWERTRVAGLAVDLPQRQLSIEHIHLLAPEARLAIHAGGGSNIGDLLVRNGSSDSGSDNSGGDNNHSGENRPGTQETGTTVNAEPWNLRLQRVDVEQGRLDFSDDNLALPFRAFIQGLEGSIEGLDTGAGERARIDLSGNVDGYAPVALVGSAQPLASPPELDISFNFHHLDLATLTPYSGTYAGYAIDRGLLTVNLDYTLSDGRIRGNNRVIIDQLRLGQRVDSPRALELPLRLAIALLTDSRGVMDLGVEVSGDMDDPNFHIGAVIWQAFRNLIVRTATAPFRFLANLVGSERDLDRIEFEAGSSTLAADADAVLRRLAEALQQRPALRLTVAGHYHRERDLDALAEERLAQQLRQAGIDDETQDRRDAAWERALERLYREQLPEGEAQDSTGREAELLAHLAPPAAALPRLAADRAMAVKQALISQHGLAGDRVLVERDQTPPGENNAVLLGAGPM